MKKRHKVYLKLNLVSIFFIVVSFISVTLAWFAYSGLAKMETEVSVKAWYIEFEKNNNILTDDIVISFDDIYPGMDTISEVVNINNKGDSDANISYEIESARILEDSYELSNETSSLYIEDKLSHEYPFHININLNKNYVLSNDDTSTFEISVSWPLDSNNDELDSYWGKKAYEHQLNEQSLLENNPEHQIESAIKITLSLKAEQYIDEDNASDPNYSLGTYKLYDYENNMPCDEISSTCLKSYVINIDNKQSNDTVELLPDIYNSYGSSNYNGYDTLVSNITNNWQVNYRPLQLEDILKIISTDINNSFVVLNDKYSSIIGNLKYNDRINSLISNTITNDGYYSYLNEKFPYLSSNRCYWLKTEYDINNSFSFYKKDETTSLISKTNKTNICDVVPVVIINKSRLT